MIDLGLTKKQFFIYAGLLFVVNLFFAGITFIFIVLPNLDIELPGAFFLGTIFAIFYYYYTSIITLIIPWIFLHFFLVQKYKTNFKETILILLILIGFGEIVSFSSGLRFLSLKIIYENPYFYNHYILALITSSLGIAGFFLLTIFYPLWKISSLPGNAISSKMIQHLAKILTFFMVIFNVIVLSVASTIPKEEFAKKKEFISQLQSGEKGILEKCQNLSKYIGWNMPCGMLAAIAEKEPSYCEISYPIEQVEPLHYKEARNDCKKLATGSLEDLKKHECLPSSITCNFALGIFLQDKSLCRKIRGYGIYTKLADVPRNTCLSLITN